LIEFLRLRWALAGAKRQDDLSAIRVPELVVAALRGDDLEAVVAEKLAAAVHHAPIDL
jgi:hypothetical protein